MSSSNKLRQCKFGSLESSATPLSTRVPGMGFAAGVVAHISDIGTQSPSAPLANNSVREGTPNSCHKRSRSNPTVTPQPSKVSFSRLLERCNRNTTTSFVICLALVSSSTTPAADARSGFRSCLSGAACNNVGCPKTTGRGATKHREAHVDVLPPPAACAAPCTVTASLPSAMAPEARTVASAVRHACRRDSATPTISAKSTPKVKVIAFLAFTISASRTLSDAIPLSIAIMAGAAVSKPYFGSTSRYTSDTNWPQPDLNSSEPLACACSNCLSLRWNPPSKKWA
mmetsp:Transcript_59669/g.172226  ORF Transcript_59669/g.172226 Transcript_59669/m.172226 type:complete len:285 (+) Transcript_59669:1170-2024(+)